MEFKKTLSLVVNEDGQFVLRVTDSFGTEETVLSRKESRATAEQLITIQDGEKPRASAR